MRFAPPTNTCAAMSSSSRFKVPARNHCNRGFRDPPPPPPPPDAAAAQEGGAAPPFVSGDSHLKTVRDANYDLRRRPRGGAAGPPRGALHQSFGRWRPPAFGPPPPPYGHPAPSYDPPPPSYGLPTPFYGHPPPQSYSPALPPYGHPPPSHDPPTPFLPLRPSFNPPPSTFRPQAFHPSPQRKPVDYRNWRFCLSQPPPQCERFVVLSYNILADYLARDHRPRLYFHIPQHILDWEWRKRRLLLEFRLWAPDIMCLQEVDRFHDLEEELATQGYAGIWKMRTGNAVDGCAIFWRSNRFQLKYDETIEFNKLGLRDNVAQICVLESRIQYPVENESASLPKSSDQSRRANLVVVCNIHVLYNPKRGEIKLGQVRTLLHRAHAVSKIWNDAPVVVCGDFNSTPKSPLYNFIAEQKLILSGLARDQVSGQHSACISSSRIYTGPAMSSAQPDMSKGTEGNCKPQTKTENKYLTEEAPLPERGNGLLDIPELFSKSQLLARTSTIPDVATDKIGEGESLSSEFCSADSRNVQISTDTCRSCSQLSRSHGAAPTISSIDQCSAGGHSDVSWSMPEFSQSKQNVSNGDYESSSFRNKEPSDLVADLSAQAENRMAETSAGTAFHEVVIDNEVQKENHSCSGAPSSEISIQRSSGDRHKEVSQGAENVLDNDVSTEASSSDMVSGAVPAVSEVSSENIKSFPVMICQTTCESKPFDISACGNSSVDVEFLNQSLDEESKTRKEDSSSSRCLKSSYCHNEPKQSISDAASLSADFDSTLKQCSNHLENRNSVGEDDNICKYISGSEENSDPDFFRELLVTDDRFHFSDDSVSVRNSGQNWSSASSYSSELDPSSVKIWEKSVHGASSLAAGSEKYSYNPYLWTPMEIEVASGSADCTSLEHSLELRSVYTDVEDYAGTKDSSREPQVTSYNRQFMGTVDYIWSSEGLQTSKVLDTFPKHVLQQTSGFPTKRWGSDHVALACELAFVNGSSVE